MKSNFVGSFGVSFKVIKITVSLLAVMFVGGKAAAGDIEWSGLYRAEGFSMRDMLLDRTDGKTKEYGVHNLILRPKIVAADGVTIQSQFSIFNGASSDGREGNQFGTYFGNGLGDSTPESVNDSSSQSETQEDEEIRINQFYMTLKQEHGALIVGRAPLQFGLGISHNAGRGLFDHYSDTRDMVGYKVVSGNFYIFPMFTKVQEGDIADYDDVREFNVHFQYENPETDTAMGVFYQNRKASKVGNDAPQVAIGGGSGVRDGEYNVKNFNVFYSKETPDLKVGFELAQQRGDSGVSYNGNGVDFLGYGAALELEYHPTEKKWATGFKMGFATGDDPSTEAEYEGFVFDRNYDVAMLLFNHGMGQADFLSTNILGRSRTDADGTVNDKPDVEAVGNTYYISPYYRYRMNERWDFLTRVTFAWLNETEIALDSTASPAKADADDSLGYEIDLSFVFRPSERIQWINEFGYFEPGKAWEADGNFQAQSAYGFATKAAVSF